MECFRHEKLIREAFKSLVFAFRFQSLAFTQNFFLEKTPPGEKTKNFSRKKSNSFKEWIFASSSHLNTWTFLNRWNANKILGSSKTSLLTIGINVKKLYDRCFNWLLRFAILVKNVTWAQYQGDGKLKNNNAEFKQHWARIVLRSEVAREFLVLAWIVIVRSYFEAIIANQSYTNEVCLNGWQSWKLMEWWCLDRVNSSEF